jgi:hypothetical protein
MSTDYRALCAELLGELQALRRAVADEVGCPSPEPSVILRARAALSQPEPMAPTDEDIDDWHSQCADLTRRGAADHYWAFDLQSDEVAGVVRAALARWGTP